MNDTQSEARARRFAGLRAELEALRGTFDGLKRRVSATVKDAAKRRDDWLLDHVRKEHLG